MRLTDLMYRGDVVSAEVRTQGETIVSGEVTTSSGLTLVFGEGRLTAVRGESGMPATSCGECRERADEARQRSDAWYSIAYLWERQAQANTPSEPESADAAAVS